MLAQLGHPERSLPPVLHVAGTNGKGSTCAFLRAMGEAAGLRVHVYTSPHLVRFNERIRLAGELVSDELLDATLEEVERVNAGAADHRVRGVDRRRASCCLPGCRPIFACWKWGSAAAGTRPT